MLQLLPTLYSYHHPKTKGMEQAEFTGLRLKELSLPYTKIIQSSMTRAKETASIISKHLPDLPIQSCDFLREGSPIKPVPDSPHWRPEAKVSFVLVCPTSTLKRSILYDIYLIMFTKQHYSNRCSKLSYVHHNILLINLAVP